MGHSVVNCGELTGWKWVNSSTHQKILNSLAKKERIIKITLSLEDANYLHSMSLKLGISKTELLCKVLNFMIEAEDYEEWSFYTTHDKGYPILVRID